MSEVTVRATQSIAGFLNGEVKTIERTRFIDRLIAQESLVVLAGGTIESGLVSLTDGDINTDLAVPTDSDAEYPWVVDGQLVVPKKGANRKTWSAFLTAAKFAFPEAATRDELWALYQEHAKGIDLTVEPEPVT